MTHAVTEAMVARQAALEAEMVSRGTDLFRKSIHDAKAEGLESTTPYGSHLVRRAIAPVTKGIRDFLAAASSGRPGKKHVAAVYLRGIEPEVAAFLALRSCLNIVSKKLTLQNAAIKVAQQLEAEARLAFFEQKNPDEYRKATKATEHSGNERYKQTVYSYIAGKNGVDLPSWPKRDKLLLGQKLIEIVIDATGYVEVITDYKADAAGRSKAGVYTYHLVATPRCLEWISRMADYSSLAMPEYMPTIVPPRPWTGPYGGGYYTLYKPLMLVKNGPANYLEELALAGEEMSEVYNAVNSMQETGYAINRRVLDVLRGLWDNGGDVAGIPHRETYNLPRCPICGQEIPPSESRAAGWKHPCFEDESILKSWKRDAAIIYERNVVSLSRRIQFAKILWLAEKFQEEAAIYFPMQLDFRGRVYAVPSFLNPQGEDAAKGLLLFAEGKPLTTPEAVMWLAVHGANTWGNDKVSLEDRHAWVLENEREILAVAADPYACRMWHDADKPAQFLAFCFEWAAFRAAEQRGETFISHLPVAMDGTCNGLQIFSLLLRDPVGGAATNLLPADKPQDIYQIVADKTLEKLRHKAEHGVSVKRKDGGDEWYDEREMARSILALGLGRKGTKRQVMVLPYGGTFQACCEYTLDHLNERMEAGETSSGITPDNAFAASRFLAALIWDSIGETVIAAKAAMTFLQELASLAAAEGLPVVWTTPVGFLVSQAYYDLKEYRVKTRLGASIIRLIVREEGEEKRIDKRRQRNGISPNFVHSLDAAAMCRSITLARKEGVSSFMMIHDSYGTHAADAATLARCLRTAFVRLFTEQDVLADLRDAVAAMLPAKKRKNLPDLPAKGNLDITKVLHSAYFFA